MKPFGVRRINGYYIIDRKQWAKDKEDRDRERVIREMKRLNIDPEMLISVANEIKEKS